MSSTKPPVTYLVSGPLYKKRGGLGRHSKQPWQPRTFALSSEGVLSYFESAALEKCRGSLNLVQSRAALTTTESIEDAPTRSVLILSHAQGQRWKLCAEAADDLATWREKLEPFCRAAPKEEEAAAPAAAPEGAEGETRRALADRRAAFDRAGRRGPRPRLSSSPVSTLGVLGIMFVVEACAIVSRGGVIFASLGALALLNVYATLVLVRKHDEAPSETLVSLIIPPAALPSFRSLDAASPSPAKAEARAGKLHAGGSGLEGVPFSPDGDVPCGTWSPAPGATFKIRQLGYAKSKRKAPSVEAFYEVVAVDLFDTEARVGRMAERLELPAPARPSPDADVPALYVVNAMIPSETGPMRVRVDADGHGYQMVICMQLTEETCADLEALAAPPADGARAVAPERRAALELLKMYCRVAPTEGQLDAKERGRFKVLAQIRNIDEVNIPSFAKGYNGKPALINKTGCLTKGPDNAYHNMDINIHAFGYMARSGLQSIFRDFQDFILSVGFVLEGRAESELPECMLCSMDLNHCDFNMAVPW